MKVLFPLGEEYQPKQASHTNCGERDENGGANQFERIHTDANTSLGVPFLKK